MELRNKIQTMLSKKKMVFAEERKEYALLNSLKTKIAKHGTEEATEAYLNDHISQVSPVRKI